MFTTELKARGSVTHLQMCAEAARLLVAAEARYDHVVIDEAQDLHPAQWRVLRAAVEPGPDDLFITGDPHQRIYDSRVSLGSLGISVKGRTSRLRINYRSTEEILAWSTGILGPAPVEDLGGEGNDSLVGYRSLLHGRRPHVNGYGSEQAEVAALVERVQDWIAQGIRPAEIGVCTRFNVLLDKCHDKLVGAGVAAVRVKDNLGPDTDGVRLATMHAMKGLEFRAVAVLGVTATAVPFAREITPAGVDGLQHETDLLRERCLLFVACTRAREALSVSWSGTASRFLPVHG
jgi:superfamily I DNA/RNA helicase